MTFPAPIDVIIDLPAGSTGSNYNYNIPSENLDILSSASQSSLLAVSNLGSAVSSVINSGLDLIRSFETFETYLLDGTQLDSLANNTASANYTYTNTDNKFLKIIIILGTITPVGTPKVLLRNGSNVYEITIPSGTDQKRIEFNNIPVAFLNSFQVENKTGTTFASSGNSIIVQGL